jgi:hypothetical protein
VGYCCSAISLFAEDGCPRFPTPVRKPNEIIRKRGQDGLRNPALSVVYPFEKRVGAAGFEPEPDVLADAARVWQGSNPAAPTCRSSLRSS